MAKSRFEIEGELQKQLCSDANMIKNKILDALEGTEASNIAFTLGLAGAMRDILNELLPEQDEEMFQA